jgi:hypothetical protein
MVTEFRSKTFNCLSVKVDNTKHDETLKAIDDVADHRKLKKDFVMSCQRNNVLFSNVFI